MISELFSSRFKQERKFLTKQWSRVLTQLLPFLLLITGAVGYFYQKEAAFWSISERQLQLSFSLLFSMGLVSGKVKTQIKESDSFYLFHQQQGIRKVFPYFFSQSLLSRLPFLIFIMLIFIGIQLLLNQQVTYSIYCDVVLLFLLQGIDFYLQLHQFESTFVWGSWQRLVAFIVIWLIAFLGSMERIMLAVLGIVFMICVWKLKNETSTLFFEKMIDFESLRKQKQIKMFSWFVEMPRFNLNEKASASQSQAKFLLPFKLETSAGSYYLARTLPRDWQFVQLFLSWLVVLVVLLYSFVFTWLSAIIGLLGFWLANSSIFGLIVEKLSDLPNTQAKCYTRDLFIMAYGISLLLLIVAVAILMIFNGMQAMIYLLGGVIILVHYFIQKNKH